MLVACPSCQAQYDIADSQAPADGSVIACSACGHSWLEGRALAVIEDAPYPFRTEAFDAEGEAERIAAAAREVAARAAERRRRRRAALKGWAMLAAAVALPVGVAVASPETVVRAAPIAARLYAKAGIEVNVRGFDIRGAKTQLMLVSDTRVLAVKGEVVNVAAKPRKVPSIRFVLHDAAGREVYAWTLAGVSARELAPGEATSFTSRLASPPALAQEVEIRFARAEEMGVNAGP
jgi:predicted Zn finger-like uncharacterized protein